jgi:hypothetical protein
MGSQDNVASTSEKLHRPVSRATTRQQVDKLRRVLDGHQMLSPCR